MSPDEYCRQIEAYLCRKNDGHLIRIVGPSFERVVGWAEQGIPLRIACQGIDAYFTRYYAKGSRRRPVHIDFCEHDVLDAFDAWRRAVGVRHADAVSEDDRRAHQSRRSLPAHLDRIAEKATNRRAGMTPPPAPLDGALEAVAREAGAFRDLPGPLRGETRERIVARLLELDRAMIDAAKALLTPETVDELRAEAAGELRAFRDRMPSDEYSRAIDAALDRLVREHEQLPEIAFE